MSSVLLVDIAERIATVTLNRPEARNALSAELIAKLQETMTALDSNDDVDVIILTGSDPAFSAGLDLKQLGSDGGNLKVGQKDDTVSGYPWPRTVKPVIGAINGVAVTGGLELALNCDILIASEKARFADTHARVGVLPGWGLSVLLPLYVGRGMARRMSLTGDFLSAEDALRTGMVTEVVAHEDLLERARQIAATIAGNDQPGVRELLGSYHRIELEQIGGGYAVEAKTSRDWMARGFDPAEVEARREAIRARGRTQTGS